MSLKKKLKNRELTFGSWVTIGHPAIVEIMAGAGFEWLTIDMEHSAISLESAQVLITTIQAKGMAALVRVSSNDPIQIKRVMDAGADGVIVPMVNSKEQAEQAVSSVKYPPKGKRGVGLYRAQDYGFGFESYRNWLAAESVVIAQIEHIDAVRNIDRILSVQGLDGIIVGPYDLSGSMGKPGEYDLPEVVEALDLVVGAAFSMEKSLGFHVVPADPERIKMRIEQGYNFLAYSLDFMFLGESARNGMDVIRKHAGGIDG